jgi:hypothetical protein
MNSKFRTIACIAFAATLMTLSTLSAEEEKRATDLKEVTVYGYSEMGVFGKFLHSKEPYNIDKQVTVRANRDTLYSFGVFDLDAGPLTVTLPKTNGNSLSRKWLNSFLFKGGFLSFCPALRTL